MPPGFMKATTAPPLFAGLVDASCASAITSPSADSPERFVERVMSDVTEPTTRFAIAADIAPYLAMIAVWAASFETSRVTISLSAVALVIWSLLLSIARLILVIIRPNELALVTRWPAIEQL